MSPGMTFPLLRLMSRQIIRIDPETGAQTILWLR